MLGTHDLLLFVVSGVLLNVTPGPDMLYIMSRSGAQGWRAGLTAALGIGAGCFVHILAAAVGLSAVLATSATAFNILKIAGAIYLGYVGISMLLSRSSISQPLALPPARLTAIFAQGFLTNALNPKVALFFLAFVPQFIEVDAPRKAFAFLFLGTLFNINATLWNLLVAWLTARAGTRFRDSAVVSWLTRGIGALFVVLGVRLAFTSAKVA